MFRKTYIWMGVPSCITEELLLQDYNIVLEATRMTKWNNNSKLANHTDMVKVVLIGEEQSARFTRGYVIFGMRPFASIVRSSATMPAPADIAQADITPTNARTTNNGHLSVETADRSIPLQVASAQREWTPRRKQRLH